MSSVVHAPAIDVSARRVARSRFYLGMSAAMLLVVFVGFARTLYLRELFDVPAIPVVFWVHGIAMTTWYVGAILQPALVTSRRTDLHKKCGWALVVVAVAAVLAGVAVDVTFVPRRLAMGAPLAALTGVVWSDRAALLWFGIFVGAAIRMRRNPEAHKRLMLLASISVLQPATSRIWRWPFFVDLGLPPSLLGYSVLSLLIVAIATHDIVTRRRIHPVTLIGGPLFIATKVLFVFVIARTPFGINTVIGGGQ